MPPIEAPVSAHCLDPLPNRNVTNSRPTRPECPCESGTSFRPGQKSDHRHCPLRARRERPCGCAAAEKGDEIEPPHGVTPKDLGSSIAGRGRASQQKRPAHVRFGSFSSDRHAPDARGMSASPPRASKRWHRSETTRRAKSGLMHRNKMTCTGAMIYWRTAAVQKFHMALGGQLTTAFLRRQPTRRSMAQGPD